MMKTLKLVILVSWAAAGCTLAYTPVGSGGAPLFGVNVPTLNGVRGEFDALNLSTPGRTYMMGGTFRYSFPGGLQLGYYGGGWSFATGDVFADGTVKECRLDFGVHHFVSGYKKYFGDKWGLFAGGGAGLFTVTYTKKISTASYRFGNVPFPETATYVAELDGMNWSAQAFVAPQYRLNAWLAVGLEAGYFYMNVAEGKMEEAGVPGVAAPELDLSGPFVRAGPMFNF